MFDRQALDELDTTTVLEAAVACRASADRAEADLLTVAAHFADLHPAPPGTPRAGYGDPTLRVADASGSDLGTERLAPLAGDGTPAVAEFAPEELAVALGISGFAAARLIGDALELRHRLPRLWALVHEGRLQAWKARQVASETTGLSRSAVDFVDRHVAVVARRNRIPQVRALVHEALLRCDPDVAAGREQAALDRRGVWADHRESTATTRLTIIADTPDALAFEDTVADVAAGLGRLGDQDPLDVRRARAVGVLADPQRSLDLLSGGTDGDGADGPGRRPRSALLYLHVDTAGGGVEAEGLGALTPELLAHWLEGLDHVSVRPVLHMAGIAAAPADGYAPPPRMREQVRLRDRTCVFPGCQVPSRRCDLDHVVPYDPAATRPSAGATHPDNLAPLCRRHHRLKTHGRWRYERLAGGGYQWTSPRGIGYPVDAVGTRPRAPDPPPEIAAPDSPAA